MLAGPDAITQSPRGGILVCEDGAERGRQRAPIAGSSALTPDGKLNDFAKVTEPMQLHDHIAADLLPLNPRPLGPTRRSRARASAHSEAAGVGFSPDGKWLFLHIQYPGETFAITGPWDKGWL